MSSSGSDLDTIRGATERMSTYADDELVVNYKDVCIYGRDLRLLRGKNNAWLNDACLNYHSTRLQERSHDEILVMDPAVTSFFMHQCVEADELDEFRRDHDRFQSYGQILIPVNDTMLAGSTRWMTPGTGVHWSLLQLEKAGEKQLIVRHYDSAPGSGNLAAATSVATKMQVELGYSKSFVEDVPVPRQTNGHDCGVHVLLALECLIHGISDVGRHLADKLRNDPDACSQLRLDVENDILAQAGAQKT